MGIDLHRIKGWIYGFVIVVILALVIVRTYNDIQRTTYLTRPINGIGTGIQVALNYPAKIPSSKTEASYPLTITFANQARLSPAHTYEFVFESPTLLFTDSQGDEVSPRVQITGDYALIEKIIYVRPFLAQQYPNVHKISAKVLVDGQEIKNQPDFIEIKNEPEWFSYASLFAASILEISVVLGLAGWIINFIDESQTSKKELLEKRRDEIQKIVYFPILERMQKFIDLEKKIEDERLTADLRDDLQQIKKSLSDSECEFLQVVGELLQQGKSSELTNVKMLYDRFFEDRKDSISALAKMLKPWPPDQTPIPLISSIVKLWDDFDTDVKDLVVAVLDQFPDKDALSNLPGGELEKEVFCTDNRRRLLRSETIHRLFPQLAPPPFGYDAKWHQAQKHHDKSKISDWLKQPDRYLVANPFDYDFWLNPFYPQGVVWPDQWESFVLAPPHIAACPAAEDIYPLAVLLREECLSEQTTRQPNFPILISLQREDATQSPLITWARAAARTWLDVLSSNSDALLNLPLVSQQTLLELLCWSVGAKKTLINTLEQNDLKNDTADGILERKIIEFESCISPAHLPSDQVLLVWLGIRPPGLEFTNLILCLDGNLTPPTYAWCEHFSPFIPVLFQNKIVTKALAPTPAPLSLSLPKVQLSWSDGQLKNSLIGQFDAAMDPDEKRNKSTHFHELFGPNAIEEETTGRLISASCHSLTRMLALGNRLLQKHCAQEVPEKYLSPEELDGILKGT